MNEYYRRFLSTACFWILLNRYFSNASIQSKLISPFGLLKTPPIFQQTCLDNLKRLKDSKYTVWTNFLSKEDIMDISNDIDNRYDNGNMFEAGVKGSTSSAASIPYNGVQQRTVISQVRNTSIEWLDILNPKSEIESKLLKYLDAFRMKLSEELSLDLSFDDTEVLYARYPMGGFYKKHCDSHEMRVGGPYKLRDTERKLSLILYVNQHDWSPKDGGELRMYGNEFSLWPDHIDVSPIPGTLLLFESPDFVHEVLPTEVCRRAVVGWFRVRAKPINLSGIQLPFVSLQ